MLALGRREGSASLRPYTWRGLAEAPYSLLLDVGDAAGLTLGARLLAAFRGVAQDAVANAAPGALDAPLGEQGLASSLSNSSLAR